MTHAIIPLSALARFPLLFLAWAALADVKPTGRHRADVDESATTNAPLPAVAADPGWPTGDQVDEQDWPDTAPVDSPLLGDHIRHGHLGFEVRHALATVIELHILGAGSGLLMPTALLAALESVIHRFVLDHIGSPVAISDHLRGGHLSHQVRDALGTVLDVYLALDDTHALPTVLLASLEQVHQLVAAPVRAAAAARTQDQAVGGDPR